jgi:sugar lactone lactonase YvrE
MRAFRASLPALVIALGVASPAWASGSAIQEVASGLNSPRHLEFGSHGDLYVAEAGKGGSGPCFVGGEGPACMGNSGSVTKVDTRGRQTRVVTGLASYANTPNFDNAIGPHGIAVLPLDVLLVTNGGPTEPKVTPQGPTISRDTLAAQNPVADRFGRILAIAPHLRPVNVADMWAFERDHNPDGAGGGNPAIDSNPVDVEVDGLRLVVADAGANALNSVDLLGRIKNLAVFPNRAVTAPIPNPQMQAVPTSVEVGPDRDYYVSQLTGFPFPVGGANIYRVPRSGGTPVAVATGFTMIMDMAFGRDGTLYVLEIDANGLLAPPNEGALFAISRKGEKRQIALPAGALPFPGGIAIGKDGLYVTTNAGSPGDGKVIRIRL